MKNRFLLLAHDTGYDLIDLKPCKCHGDRSGVEFNNRPYHPQFGVGMSFELNPHSFAAWKSRKFNNARRIRDARELNQDCRKLIREFIRDCGGLEADAERLQAHETVTFPQEWRFTVRYRSKGGGYSEYKSDSEYGVTTIDKAKRYASRVIARRIARDCNDQWIGEVVEVTP